MSAGTAMRSDAIPNENLITDSQQELAFKKCGIPNKMGLNKNGLEFLSSGQTKAGTRMQCGNFFWPRKINHLFSLPISINFCTTTTTTGEFAWTVAILRELNQNSRKQTLLYSGAGSLIHPSVVLTAANKHHTIEMDIVRAGEWDFGTTDEEHPYQDRDIAHVYSLDTADLNSVQLIFVTKPFVLAINVRTICLPLPGHTEALAEKRDCTTAAWGQQNCSSMKGLHSILGRAELSTDTQQSTCESDWQQYLEDLTFKLKSNQFCTMRKHSIDDACFCDHGAPLFCPIQQADDEATQYEQIGISIASGGCTRELPGRGVEFGIFHFSLI